MNNNTKSIFNHNIQLLNLMDKVIYYFRIQNYDKALRIATDIINHFSSNLEDLILEIDYFNNNVQLIELESIMQLLNELLEAQECYDYVLLADLYEIKFIPFLISIQETIIKKEEHISNEIYYTEAVNTLENIDKELAANIRKVPETTVLFEKGYIIEYTSCGLITLAITDDHKKRYYMHSNRNASNEAFHLAYSWISEDKTSYIIYGLGLGYHIKELVELDNNIKIEIYESDLNIIKLACTYTEMKSILENANIRLVYDPDFNKLTSRLNTIDDDTEFVMHHPSIRNVKDSSVREKLEEYFIQYSSVRNQRRILNSNYKENILHYDGSVDDLSREFAGKDLYIIAAGPSLDKNFLELKKVKKEKSIILATGTVFKKLLNEGITPDYVIITDANPRVYGQISYLETSTVPLLYLSTAYQGFARNYQGKKYIIYQKDFAKAEEMAQKFNLHTFSTGGSVSTTALDIGIYFKCNRIIFLGLDLAYTDNFIHAADTSRRVLESSAELLHVTDIYGNQINTTKVLNIYRKWIEDRIRGVKDIKFIDATEGGARIEGMNIMKLSDTINFTENSANS